MVVVVEVEQADVRGEILSAQPFASYLSSVIEQMVIIGVSGYLVLEVLKLMLHQEFFFCVFLSCTPQTLSNQHSFFSGNNQKL